MLKVGMKRNNINTPISLMKACRRSKSFKSISMDDIPCNYGELQVLFRWENDFSIDFVKRMDSMGVIPFYGKIDESEYVYIANENMPFSYMSDTGDIFVIGKLYNAEKFFNEALKTGKCKCCACDSTIKKGNDSFFYYAQNGDVVSAQHTRHNIFAEALCSNCSEKFDISRLRTGSNFDTKFSRYITSHEKLVTELLKAVA